MPSARKISSYFLAGTGVLLLSSATAQAEDASVRVAGGVSFGADVHVNIGSAVETVVDSALDVLGDVEFGVDFGIRFAQPPPPPQPSCDYSCGAAVPSYYVAPRPVYVEPVYVDHQPIVVARPRESFSRWGLGAFAGSFDVDGQEAGTDLGLVAQYRLSRSFALEAEIAKSKIGDGARTDRRLGASLSYDLAPRRNLSPFLLVGAGFGQTELGDGMLHAEQAYGEVGAGLRYRLTRALHVVADIRAGARNGSEDDVLYLSTEPMPEFEQDEKYSRLRIGGLIYF